MRIVVHGAGAIGSLFAALLHRVGEDVLIVGAPTHVEAIRAHGLRLEGRIEGTFRIAAETRLPPKTDADLLLLTVKTFDLPRAAAQAAQELPWPIPWLLPQNGLGAERVAMGALRQAHPKIEPSPWIVRALNTLPVTLVAPGVVSQPGDGELRLADPTRAGPSADSVRRFAHLLERAGIAIRFVPDIEEAAWRKAAVNAAINPVTADHGVLNGSLLEDPGRSEAEALLREALEAARLAGYDLPTSELEADLWHTVRATAGNRSSMLQDLDRGRPTEIDSISGVLLETARAHGVELPATERIVGRIHQRASAGAHRRGEPS